MVLSGIPSLVSLSSSKRPAFFVDLLFDLFAYVYLVCRCVFLRVRICAHVCVQGIYLRVRVSLSLLRGAARRCSDLYPVYLRPRYSTISWSLSFSSSSSSTCMQLVKYAVLKQSCLWCRNREIDRSDGYYAVTAAADTRCRWFYVHLRDLLGVLPIDLQVGGIEFPISRGLANSNGRLCTNTRVSKLQFERSGRSI